MEFHVEAEDPTVRQAYEWTVVEEGYDLAEDVEDAVIVSVGGDGSILYNTHRYGDPTILPVRYGDSVGKRCTVEPEEFVDALHALDEGAYEVHEHHKLGAYDEDGEPLRGDLEALNEIGMHHVEPNKTAMFSFTVDDPYKDIHMDMETVRGDGVIVSTPFGSTGYFATIMRGTDLEDGFEHGMGVALNNPIDWEKPDGLVLTGYSEVTFRVLDKHHKSSAKLYADIADPYEPDVGEEITVRPSEKTVEILDPDV